ncbi:MAG: Hpt domain-containing protein, partial [Wenzhouxiangellaceae bacterium]
RPYLVALCDEIRQALEAWAGEPDADAPDLSRARAAAGQLAASLATLGVAGAAGLADSLGRALDAIDKPDPETATVLLESVAVLPDYLERLETGAPDIPEVLAGFINRTCAAAGLEPLAAVAAPTGIDALNDDDSGDFRPLDADGLRRGYQRALRDWLKDSSDIRGLGEFTKALQAAPQLQLRRLGKVAEAAFKGLAGGQLKPGSQVQAHLASLDQMLRRLSEEGADAPVLAQADEVALALLDDVQGAAPGCPEIDRICAATAGAETVDAVDVERARSVLSGRNRELFTAIAEAARGELNQAKDALNAFLLGRKSEGSGIGEQAGLLRSVAESFGMLGLERLKQRVRQQADRLGELTADPENPVLLDVARELLLVESELDEAVLYLGEAPESDLLEGDGQHLPKAEHRRVMRQLLNESLDDLGQAKHLLDQVHRGQADADGVEQSIRILRRVSGVLHMSGQPVAADMLEASAACVADEMTGDATNDADRERLDALAEALVVVEFYLDSLTRLDDRGAEYLHDARSRLIDLGYLGEPASTPAEEADRQAAPTDVEFESDVAAEPEEEAGPEVEAEPEAEAEAEQAPEPEAESESGSEAEDESAAAEAETADDEPLSIDFDALMQADEEALEAAEPSDEAESADEQPLSIDFEPSAGPARPESEDVEAVEPADESEAAEAAEGLDFDERSDERKHPEAAEPTQASEHPEEVEPTDTRERPEEAELADTLDAADELESAPQPQDTGFAGGSALDGDDFDLMSFFLEEFDEELEALRQRFPEWQDRPTNQSLLTDIRRSFHTLKGSGRMAGAERIGAFAWEIEQLLNQTLDGQYTAEQVVGIVGEAIEALPSLRAQLVGEPAELDDEAIDALLSRVAGIGRETDLPELEGMDPTLVQLMVKEINDHLETIDRWIETSHRQGWPADVDRDLIRSVHTIKGTLRLAPIGDEADSMQLIEEYLQEVLDTDSDVAEPAVDLMEDLRALLGKRLDRLQRRAVSTDHFNTAYLASQARTMLSAMHHEAQHDKSAQESTDPEAGMDFAELDGEPQSEVSDEQTLEQEVPEEEAPEAEAPEEETPEEEAPEAEAPEEETPEEETPEAEAPKAEAPEEETPEEETPEEETPEAEAPEAEAPEAEAPEAEAPEEEAPEEEAPEEEAP